MTLSVFQMNAQFTESFESGIPGTWTVINGGDTNGWVAATPGTGSANTGTNVAKLVYDASVAHDDYLVTQQFTVTAGLSDRLSLWYKHRSNTFPEPFDVLLSTGGNTAPDFTVTIASDVTPNTTWQQAVYDFTAYVGQTVYVAFYSSTLNEWELYLDDVVVDALPTATLDYYNLQWPPNGTIAAGENFDVYAQAYEAGLTEVTAGQAPGIESWIGYSATDTDPSGPDWTWAAASFNVEAGNNDEYTLNLGSIIPGPGTYYYASRWSLEEGPYTYGGILADGSNGGTWGENNNISGVLTVNPVANDECDGAISLTVNSDLACGVVTSGSTVGASASSQPDDVSGTPDNDVWFSFVATNTYHQISLTDVVAVVGTSTDMGMGLYDGSGGCNALIFTATSDPNTLTVADLTIGTTYYVRVYGWSSTNTAQTNFNICVGTPPPPPANDVCNNALVLTESADNACENAVNGTTVDAIASAFGTCSTSGKDVWYSFTPSQNSSYNFSVSEITDYGTSSTYVTLYSGSCGSLEQIGSSCTTTTLSSSQLTSGTTYYVNIRSTSSTAGVDFSLCAYTIITPENDECANATMLTVGADLSCSSPVAGTTIDSTQSLAGCVGTANDDVWYSFVAIGSIHSIIVNNTSGSTDIVTEVFEGCGGASLVCQDTPNSPVTLTGLTAGNTYYFRIYTYTSTASTRTSFNVCVGTPPPPPANDLCADAVNLVCDTPLNGTTVSATGGSGSSCLGSIGDDVWYQYTGNDSTVDLTVLSSTANEEAQVEVYSSTDGTCSGFTLATCFESDGSGENPVLLSFSADAGTTYFIRVGNWINGNAGFEFSIEATCTPYPDCGDPTDLAASVTPSTADISWTAPVAGTPIGYNWEVQPDGVAQGTAGAIDSGTTATTSDTAIGLSPETAYDLFVQTDCGGDGTSAWTGPYSFTTAATPPPNDDIAGAIALTIDAGYCDGVQNNGTNVGATDSGEGVGSCFNGANADNDVWFSVTIPSNVATIDVSTDFTGGTLVDTEIAIYSGTSGSLVEIDCSQDDGTTVLSNGFSWNSLMTDVAVTGGETYLIQVAGYGSASVGTFCIEVSTNTTLSIDSSDLNSFTYFPNPVKNTLNLKAQSNIQNVSIYNMLGQEVLRTAPNTLNSELDMASLQTGAYFVKVTINDATETIRVIKQ